MTGLYYCKSIVLQLKQQQADNIIYETWDALYKSHSARLMMNGDLTDSFLLERSATQACPLSPLLFVIFIEPLAQWTRQNSKWRV